MADQQEVIIVDDQGREHIFPPGMDPKRAAQAVRNTLLQEANARPLKEPTTFGGGFMRSLGTQADEMGKDAMLGMAYPRSGGDFLNLMLPGSRIPGLKNTAAVQGTTEAIGNKALRGGARAGAEVLDLTPRFLKSKTEANVIKGLRNASQPPTRFNELPLVKQQEHLPGFSGPAKPNPVPRIPAPTRMESLPTAETPFHERPLYQQMEELPQTPAPETARSGMPPAGPVQRAPLDVRISGKAPSLEEVLNDALMESMGGEQAGSVSLPSSPDPVGSPLRQSGIFPAKDNGIPVKMGQPGGYSSGLPPITETHYDELMGKGFGGVGEEPPLGPPGAPPGGDGVPPGPPVMDPATVAEERRMFGSREAGSRLGMSPDEVKTAAPGPSRVPLDVELKQQDAAGRAAGVQDKSLEDILKEIILARGGQL